MTINGSTNASNWTFKLEAYETSYSVSNNTSVVRVEMYLGRANSQSYLGGDWSGSITVDGQTQYLSGNIAWPTYINAGAWLYLGTKDYTVTHNTDGSKTAGISASFSSNDFSPSSAWASGDLVLTTIPRASSVTATNADIGSATSININRASSSFTHTLKYSFGSLSGTIVNKTSQTSYGWTVPTTFYAQIPNAASGQCTITCETYSGNTLIGTKTTTFTATANQELNKPDISGTVVDINNDTIALTGDNTKFIKYYSNASVSWEASAKNSASIVRVYVNSEITTTSPKVINGITTNQIPLSALDTRGYRNAITKQLDMIDYIPLTAQVSFYRTEPTTGRVSLEFDGNYFNGSFGSQNNTLSLKWYYKLKDSETWTLGGTLTQGTDYVINGNTFHSGNSEYTSAIIIGTNFDYQKAYDFKFEFVDKLESHVIEQTVSKGIPIVNWDDDHFNVNGDITQNEEPFNIPTVIDNLDGNSTTDAPSQRAVKQLTTYSTTEKKIGIYTDGKPIYRKTISGTYTTNNTRVVVELVLNVDKLINGYGTYVPNGLTPTISVGHPMINTSGGIDAYSQLGMRTNNKLCCMFSTPQGAYQGLTGSYEITVEYTKTTD